MKSIKIILLIVSMALVSCDSSKKMNFYETALIKAGEQTKYILLDFGASWCGGCRAFDKYVFDDSRTKSKLKEKFIVLKIDRDEPENKYLVDKYKISGLPQIVIINKSEKILGEVAYFDARYVKEPDLFLVRLNEIIEAQNKISNLEESFDSDSTNQSILNDLLKEYQNIGNYIAVGKIKKLLVNIDPTPERVFEYHFDKAVKAIKDEKNPEPLLTILSTTDSLDIKRKAIANMQLLYYYKSFNDVGNQDYFYQKLLRINPGYFKKEYARFLFEHNEKIDSAIILTREILLDENYRNDHWGQFLKAHSLVCQGKKTKAVNEYCNWMKKNINRWESEEYYWSLYFYARFANYYNVDLERASDYLKIAEKNRTLVDDKILLAEILYKLRETNLAIDKLTESLKYIDEKKENERIVALIAQYKKQL
jgi:thioredoxin-related protein